MIINATNYRKQDGNMKILIAYTSKHGTTEECVQRLQQHLHGLDVTLKNLAQAPSPSLVEYDIVVVGGSVQFGKFHPALRLFLKENLEVLKQKRLALFLCCGLAHEYEYYEEVLFAKELRAAAFQMLYFGGSLRTDGLPFLDKLLVRHLRTTIAENEIEDGEYTPSMPGILPENIETMASYIRREALKKEQKL